MSLDDFLCTLDVLNNGNNDQSVAHFHHVVTIPEMLLQVFKQDCSRTLCIMHLHFCDFTPNCFIYFCFRFTQIQIWTKHTDSWCWNSFRALICMNIV